MQKKAKLDDSKKPSKSDKQVGFKKQYSTADVNANMASTDSVITDLFDQAAGLDKESYYDVDINKLDLDIASFTIGRGIVIPHDNTVQEFDTDEDHQYYDSSGNIVIQGYSMRSISSRFAVSDSGADSSVLGKDAKIIEVTDRHARIAGYDSEMGPSDLYHICSSYSKTRDITGQIVLALIHQAPHLPHSENTLLSEYQMRHFGNLVDSCRKDHPVCYDPSTYGK